MDISRSNRDIAQVAGENRSVAIPSYQQNTFSEKTKYQKWYEALCAKSRSRDAPTCYTEVHHIVPRSLGGLDDESNLVRLSYREHYIAHWLLTKFHTGINLQKMQKALWAMTLKASGERITTGWQVEAAKRAVRDIELNEEAQDVWYERRRQKREADLLAHNAAQEKWIRQQDEKRWDEAIKLAKFMSPGFLEEILELKDQRDAEQTTRNSVNFST